MAHIRFRHLLLGILSGAAMIAALTVGASDATAGIVVESSIDGGSTWQSVTLTSNAFNGTIGGLTFNDLNLNSNAPGSLTSAHGSIGDNGIIYSGTPNTVELAITFSGFTNPPIPPVGFLQNNLSATIFGVGDSGNALSMTSCIFAGNAAQTGCSGAAFVTPTASVNVSSPGSVSDTTNVLMSAIDTPYSLVELVSLTVDATGDFNLAGSTTVLPVPEPMTLSVIGTALIGVGVARSRRRRG